MSTINTFRNFFLIFSLISGMHLFGAESSSPSYPLIRTISELQDKIRPGDLIALDIDENILKTGSDKYAEEGPILNLDPALSKLIDSWHKSYPASEGAKQIQVIFLTARSPHYEKQTKEQLQKLGFSENIPVVFAPNIKKEETKIPTKGQTLVDYIKRLRIKPRRVIMVDDLHENLDNINQVFKLSSYKLIPLQLYLKKTFYKLFEVTDTASHFPDKFDGFAYVKHVGGGSGGVHVLKDSNGTLFTFKCVKDPEQMKEEITADSLYRSLNIPVPAFAVYDELPNLPELKTACQGPGPYRLADFVEPEVKIDLDKMSAIMAQHFIADALLSNWDVVIGDFKNVILDKKGTLWRIDNGGSLRYRAVGERKFTGDEWDPYRITELKTMRDSSLNSDGARVYGKVTDENLKIQAQELYNHKNNIFRMLDRVTQAIHLTDPSEVRKMLWRRFDDLAQQFQLTPLLEVTDTASHFPDKFMVSATQSKTHLVPEDNFGAGVLVYATDPGTGKIVVLLGKRVRHQWWSNFGGKSDINNASLSDKTLAHTAVREVQEESLGMIHYTTLQLDKSPSHDIRNKSRVYYRMYIAPHTYFPVGRLRDAESSSDYAANRTKFGWEAEYTDYVWMPLETLLAGLDQNKQVVEENQMTIELNGKILYPPLLEMLKEPEVRQTLESLQEENSHHLKLQQAICPKERDKLKASIPKMLIVSRHTVRAEDRQQHFGPATLAEEERDLALTTVRHGSVMAELRLKAPKLLDERLDNDPAIKEMSGYLNDNEAEKIRSILQKSRLSQTQVLLENVMGAETLKTLGNDSRKEVETFLSHYSAFKNPDVSKEYTNALIEALDQEKKPEHRDKIVFYHAVDPYTSFLYDFITAFRSQLKMVAPEKLTLFRGLDNPFMTFQDVEAFIKYFKDENGKVDNDREVNDLHYADMGLSVNPFLFGNDGNTTSCSYYMFYEMKSVTPVDFESFITLFLRKAGISEKFSDYKTIYQQYYEYNNKKNTKLFQIFIDPQVVDTIAYTAAAGGKVVDLNLGNSPYHGFAKSIPIARSTPNEFEQNILGGSGLMPLQGRIFMKPSIFHDSRFVEIKFYWHHTPEVEKEYNKALNEQVQQDLSNWLALQRKSALNIFGPENPPLKKLYKELYEGKTRLQYTERDASVENALRDADYDLVKTILDQNPNIDMNKIMTDYRTGEEKSYLEFIPDDAPNRNELAILLLTKGLRLIEILNKFSLFNVTKIIEDFLHTNPSDEIKSRVFSPNSNGLTPLHLAAIHNAPEVAKLIINRIAEDMKCDLFKEDKRGRTPLHFAAIHNARAAAEFIFDVVPEDMKNNLFKASDDRYTPLHLAAANDALEVATLIMARAPKDMKNNLFKPVGQYDHTPFYIATKQNNIEIAKAILEAAPEELKDQLFICDSYDGYNPLHLSVLNNNMEMVKFIVEAASTQVREKGLFGKSGGYGKHRSPLYIAVKNNYWEMVKFIFQNFPKDEEHENLVFATDADQKSAFKWVIKHNSPELAKTFFEMLREDMKRKLFKADQYGITILHLAIIEHAPLVVKVIIDNAPEDIKIDLFKESKNYKGNKGYTIFEVAAPRDSQEALKVTLENGPEEIQKTFLNPDYIDELMQYFANRDGLKAIISDHRKTLLHWAAQHNAVDFAKRVIQETSKQIHNDLFQSAPDGCTPLHWAVKNHNMEMENLIIESMPTAVKNDLLKQLKHISQTDSKFAKFLVKNFNIFNVNSSPLHWAARKQALGIAKVIVKEAQPDMIEELFQTDTSGYTPLHWAAQNDDQEMAKLIIDHMPSAMKQDLLRIDLKKLGLLSRRTQNARRVIELILLYDPDLFQHDLLNTIQWGYTPLHWAAQNNALDAAKIIIETTAPEKKPDLFMPDKYGWTPLHYAASSNNFKIAKLIMENAPKEIIEYLFDINIHNQRPMDLTENVDLKTYLKEQKGNSEEESEQAQSWWHRFLPIGS